MALQIRLSTLESTPQSLLLTQVGGNLAIWQFKHETTHVARMDLRQLSLCVHMHGGCALRHSCSCAALAAALAVLDSTSHNCCICTDVPKLWHGSWLSCTPLVIKVVLMLRIVRRGAPEATQGRSRSTRQGF